MRKAVLYTPLRVLVSTLIFTLAAFGLTASAQVIFSSDEAQFLSDNPDLDFQNFLSAPVPDGTFVVCNAPVDANSNDDCFTPGQILPGIAFIDNPGPDPGSMLVFGADYALNANPRGPLTTNTFADTFDIVFSASDTTRVGFVAGCIDSRRPVQRSNDRAGFRGGRRAHRLDFGRRIECVYQFCRRNFGRNDYEDKPLGYNQSPHCCRGYFEYQLRGAPDTAACARCYEHTHALGVGDDSDCADAGGVRPARPQEKKDCLAAWSGA